MSKVVVINHLTLDGVMQAPGRPDEDLRGGFKYGGWALPNNDPVMGKVMGEGMAQDGPLLLGRRTYEAFYGFWPNQRDNPYTEVLNNIQKYVASTTLVEGAAAVEQLHPPQGRRHAGRDQAQGAAGQGHRRTR